MSTVSYTMLTHENKLNYTGEQIRADSFYGNTDGLHTVSVTFDDFVGRLFIEGTLVMNPQENDWFPINLTSGSMYKQYPMNSSAPTGDVGDTGADGFTFRLNVMYLRARVERTYLGDTAYDPALHGRIDKILLNV
mgnify:CR=1 FL=1